MSAVEMLRLSPGPGPSLWTPPRGRVGRPPGELEDGATGLGAEAGAEGTTRAGGRAGPHGGQHSRSFWWPSSSR